jgi:uncharacterized protein (TIGR03084 family)
VDVAQVREDLIAEQRALDSIVAGMSAEAWQTPTPSPRWSVADQIGHLAYFDVAAAVAITDPEAFFGMVNDLLTAGAGSDEAMDEFTLSAYRRMNGGELLESWRTARQRLADASATLSDDDRVNWYGPSMGSKSFLTARLMEAWAHGQDVVDALGIRREETDRLRHIARLGFITRGWSYSNRGLVVPEQDVRVELTAPTGASWVFGPDDATESVSGPARDFCLVVTQRRHVDDTALTMTPVARDWMLMAQAFAGPPTDGPPPGTRG